MTGNRYNWPSVRRDVLTLNQRTTSEAPRQEYYEFYIRSSLDVGKNFMDIPDPKAEKCVQYGDKVHFAMNFDNGIYLRGARKFYAPQQPELWRVVKGRKVVQMAKYSPSAGNSPPHYTWQIRSDQGTGHIDDSNPDPKAGVCIDELSVVFIVNQGVQLVWLAGDVHHSAPGDTDGNHLFEVQPTLDGWTNVFSYQVETRNAINDRSNYNKYRWMLRRDIGDGSRANALQCAAYQAVGKWQKLQTVDGHDGAQQEIQYHQGIEVTNTEEWSQTKAWELTVTQSITAGLKSPGETKSVESTTTVSASLSKSMTESASQSLQQSKSQTFTVNYGPGTVWQWVTDIENVCSAKPWLLKTNDLVQTRKYSEIPCCYPGMSVGNPHGPCLDNSTCFCSDDVCNADPSEYLDNNDEEDNGTEDNGTEDNGTADNGGNNEGAVAIGGKEFDINTIKGQPMLCMIFGDFCESRGDDDTFCGFVNYWCI